MSKDRNPLSEIRARAKLNLSLSVIGRRNDGYHLLNMINAPISLCDLITCELQDVSHGISLSMTGRTLGAVGDDLSNVDTNIVSRAAKAFFEKFNIRSGIKIWLNKKIPIGAGLGGGSSDAAAVLRFLCNRFIKDIPQVCHELLDVAQGLGADVPYFLFDQVSVVEGVGEVVTPVTFSDLDQKEVLVLFPNVPLETKRVFKIFAEKSPQIVLCESPPKRGGGLEVHKSIAGIISNDLELAAVSCAPVIGDLLAQLRSIPGIIASLTGSGSAVFAVSYQDNFTEDQLERVKEVSKGLFCELFESKFDCSLPDESVVLL